MVGMTRRNCSRVTAPSRSTNGNFELQSTTVDSRPTLDATPLRMQGMRPDNSSRTAIQLVGLGRPERLADGAATGVPHAFRKACATG